MGIKEIGWLGVLDSTGLEREPVTYSCKNGNEKLLIQKAKNFSLPEYLLVSQGHLCLYLVIISHYTSTARSVFLSTCRSVNKDDFSKEKLSDSGFSSIL